MDQFNQTSQSGEPWALPSPSLPPSPPPLLPTTSTPEPLALPPLAVYPTREVLYEAIQSWAKPRGYAFTGGRGKKVSSGRTKAYYLCDRCPPILPPRERIRDTQTRGTGCLFSVIALEKASGECELKYPPEVQYNTHNHLPSQSPSAHPSHRYISIQTKNIAQSFFLAGIQPQQTPTFIRQVDSTTLVQPRDIYNQNAAFRRDIQQGKSATEALIQHLQKSGIKHSILKDPQIRRLKGLFIACPESIEYLQSHHDVLLIDNTYKTCDGSGVRTPGNVTCARNIPGTLPGTLIGTLGVNRRGVVSSGLRLVQGIIHVFSRQLSRALSYFLRLVLTDLPPFLRTRPPLLRCL